MKISEELRLAASSPVYGRFFYILTPTTTWFANKYFDRDDLPSLRLDAGQKTLAYLFLAAIAESEGL